MGPEIMSKRTGEAEAALREVFEQVRLRAFIGLCACCLFSFCVHISYHTTHTTKAERRAEKQRKHRGASGGQKTRRGIEGETTGRRRCREVLLPERSSRIPFLCDLFCYSQG